MKNISIIFPRMKYPSGDIPLGPAILASVISQDGYNVSMIDTTFKPTFDFIESRLKEHNPDVVLIYSDTLMYEDAKKCANIAKKMGKFTILGGPHATVMPESIDKSVFDISVIGEGEQVIKTILSLFYDDRKLLDNIHEYQGSETKDLDSLPFPSYNLFDVETYMRRNIQLDSYNPGLKVINVLAARGCKFNCSYCQPCLRMIFGNKVRWRSPDNVAKEVAYLQETFKIDGFFFNDDTATSDKAWMLDFCKLIKDKKLIWGCNTRADTFDEELLTNMKEAGCVKLKVGVEAKSERVRNQIYYKGIKTEQINKLLVLCKKLKIQAAGYFMLGAPTETHREIWSTIWYAINSSFIEATFSITTPLPKTGLWDRCKKEGWTLSDDFSTYDYYKATRETMSPNDMSSDWLEFYKKIALFSFYLHPRRIISTIKSMWGLQGIKKAIQKLRRI